MGTGPGYSEGVVVQATRADGASSPDGSGASNNLTTWCHFCGGSISSFNVDDYWARTMNRAYRSTWDAPVAQSLTDRRRRLPCLRLGCGECLAQHRKHAATCRVPRNVQRDEHAHLACQHQMHATARTPDAEYPWRPLRTVSVRTRAATTERDALAIAVGADNSV